jgi:hypothetical protein
MYAPKCGRSVRGGGRCTISRPKRRCGGYAPACMGCLNRAEREQLGLLPGAAPSRSRYDGMTDWRKLAAGDRD